MLTDENFPDSITTGYEDPIEQLFVPLLRQTETYDVAVGYFTSGWLRDTAEGFAEFARHGGRSRWVVSPNLNHEDAEAIFKGSDTRHPKIEHRERCLIDMIEALKSETRKELCSLISANVIRFRIAEPKTQNHLGMFHAKIGVASDSYGNKLSFSGSYNLTANAKYNWENIEIYRSWMSGEEKRVRRIESQFDRLWKDDDPSYSTFEPSLNLIKYIKKAAGDYSVFDEQGGESGTVNAPEFRGYQSEAIQNWFANNGRGTFVMATGSGKTITALGAISKLITKIVHEKNSPLVVVIVLPLKHLLDQWSKEAVRFGFSPIKCYESSSSWYRRFSAALATQQVIKNNVVIALVTNATFAGDTFQKLVRRIKVNFLIVADEAHNLGSSTYLDVLPENAHFRLALSATPERYNDIFGTKSLFNYFGKAVIEFGLGDAINAGYLCPYKYYFHVCHMTENEYDDYEELSRLIRSEASRSEGQIGKTREQLRLEGRRTDLITRVESKLGKLQELLEVQLTKSGVKHTLIYCGSRKGENAQRHIERTVELVGRLGIKIRKFTSDETVTERREILDLFAGGDLEAIAAIKCLDEGVDIPQTRTAYILASTSNPREYIQRRGRVLRTSENKPWAVIHDFVISPPISRRDESGLLARELMRAREFSELALNKDDCLCELDKLDT